MAIEGQPTPHVIVYDDSRYGDYVRLLRDAAQKAEWAPVVFNGQGTRYVSEEFSAQREALITVTSGSLQRSRFWTPDTLAWVNKLGLARALITTDYFASHWTRGPESPDIIVPKRPKAQIASQLIEWLTGLSAQLNPVEESQT
ncbi:MAG TPA: hypothetical protein VLE74_03015, partial [Candidatus Saccharimonadales bacterium]|nr:hypothetical protein [Candidatus Saccharimonadales bacterium]